MYNERDTDERIIRRVLNGETDLFSAIVEKYQKKIYNIGMMFFKNPEDASDFVQDVFIKAFNNLQSFKGRSKFYFWLIRIAYNHGVNQVKGKSSCCSIVELLIPDKGISPEEIHIGSEIKKALKSAIEELPKNYRICIDFYFFYSLSYKEIRELTGFPINTIKSNVFRAKQMLRDALKGTIVEDYEM